MHDSHIEADDRSEAENLARAAHTQTVEHNGEKILLVNDDAQSYLDKADRSPTSFGKIWDKDHADEIESELRFQARKTGSQKLWDLAEAIKNGRTSNGHLVVLRDRFKPGSGLEGVATEELFHGGQIANGLIEREPNERLLKNMEANDPEAAKYYRLAMDKLWSSGRYEKSQVHAEVPAWIAAGDYNELGLTLKSAGKVLVAWLKEARASGADLSKFPDIDPRVAKETAYEALRSASGR